MTLSRLKQILVSRAERLHARAMNNPRIKRAALTLAAIFLLGGVALSLLRNPEVLNGLDWRPALLVMLLGVPITVAFNAYDFALTARLVGRRTSALKALEVSILGTAANLLPLPGATLVRVAGLKSAGAHYGEGLQATLLVGGLWIGVAFLFAGSWLLVGAEAWIAFTFLALGTVAWLACNLFIVRLSGGLSLPVLVTLTKGLLVLVDVTRILLCFKALGVDADFGQAATFAVAGVVGNAVSIVPAGLGVREAVSAALAPLVGLTAGMAFLAAALNRLLELVTMVPVALGLAFAGRLQSARHRGTA